MIDDHDAGSGAPVSATVVTEETVVAGPQIKRKDFVERIATRSGLKRKDAKLAAEAALAVLGEAIAAGEELNLPPLGKLRVVRQKQFAKASVYTCRLRRADGTESLADPEDNG